MCTREGQILLVDDDVVSRTFMKVLLQKAGYSVADASNGNEGLLLFEQLLPDLILLDAQMPDIDGFECCRKIRQLPQGEHLPILIVTGLEDLPSVTKAFEAGATDYITKPVKTPVLIGRVKYLLQFFQAEKALRENEEKYRSLITSLQEVVFQLDREGQILFINPVWAKFIGHSVENSLNQPFQNFLHPADIQRHKSKLRKAWTQPTRIFRYRSRCLNHEQQVRWVEIQLCANRDKSGTVANLSGRMIDVTDRTIHEQYRNLEHIVTKLFLKSKDPSIAIQGFLKSLCSGFDFQMGEFWQIDPLKRALVCKERWHLNTPAMKQFAALTQNASFAPGAGLPGGSWHSQAPIWVANVAAEDIFSRQQMAREVGIHSALSCPIHQGDERIGVIVLLSQSVFPPDHDLLRKLMILGSQLSQYIKRKDAEQQIQHQNEQLQSELQRAAQYVESLLPRDSTPASARSDAANSVSVRTLFRPSSTLGGDAFDYIWLDDGHLMFYLLDVAGHGVKSALLSVSVLNILRTRSLKGADFYQPETVIEALNQTFQVNEQGEDYFTLWYGVYDVNSRELKFATAGHPPGILTTSRDAGTAAQLLETDGIAVGLLDDFPFDEKHISVSPGSRLYLFSDGVFEIPTGKAGEIWGYEAWQALIEHHAANQVKTLTPLLDKVQEINGEDTLEDDFSILELSFS